MSLIILNVDEVRRTLSTSGGAFVVHDKEVDIVRFAINSGFADIVLDGQVALRVMYQRPGETEVRAQTLTYYDTDGLHNYYDWQLSQSDLAKNGSLTVALCILRTSGSTVEEWHTTPCAVKVLGTIHTDDSDEGDETITPTVAQRVAVLESMIQRVASGAPIVVSSASAMTDTNQIYVLSTDGKWYYHNGTAWTAGGEYGAVATDTTLTQAEIPADAKTVGDEFTNLKSALSNIQSVIEKEEIVNTVSLINGYRYIYSSNPVGNTPALSSGTGKYRIVDVGLAKNGGTLKIEIDQLTPNSTISLLLTDDDNIITHRNVTSNVLVLNQETGKYEGTFTLTNQKYLYFSANTSSTDISITINAKQLVIDKTLSIEGAAADAGTVGDALRTEKTVEETLRTRGDYLFSSNPPGNTPVLRTGSTYGVNKTIDVSFAAGGMVTLETPSFVQNSQIVTLICDENETIIKRNVTGNILSLQDGVYRGKIKVPTNAKYLLYSAYRGSSTSLTLKLQRKSLYDQSRVRYVAANGDDTADGMSASTPMATLTKAIDSGGQTILLAGGKYFQNIDLTNAVNEIHIAPSNKDALPVLYAPSSIVAETETAVTGYTKVYSCECAQTFDNKNIWIFQEGVPDASTTITTNDRHPLQRGKACRCDDTKIVLCTSTTLADALVEIENASVCKWFVDTENHVLYFSRPQAVTQANPIMASFGGSVFQNITRGIHITMTGIGVKYQKVNLVGMIAPVLTDCFCGNIRGAAAFQWDGTSGARLYRCEAFRVFYSSSSGDGFNAHSDKTGDAFAKQTGCFLFDCWAHDCCDDGYSDHERCEITIFGGLFENNGAGVTPAVGSHCTCYNVLSRYNGEADFFYTGDPESSEGGVGGQIACYGCISKGKETGKGFRLNGSEIQGLFVNCVVIDRQYGFFSESNNGTQVGTLINCSTVNCSTPKSSIFTTVNGAPVT